MRRNEGGLMQPGRSRTDPVNELINMLPWMFGLVAAAAAVKVSK
ncbi:hypothetical protein ACFQS7_05215 [Dankookia sp. GCM10030260]